MPVLSTDRCGKCRDLEPSRDASCAPAQRPLFTNLLSNRTEMFTVSKFPNQCFHKTCIVITLVDCVKEAKYSSD